MFVCLLLCIVCLFVVVVYCLFVNTLESSYIHIRSVRVLMRRFARFLDAETNEKLIQSFLSKLIILSGVICFYRRKEVD